MAHVWFFDANHCPGAAVILFFVLHTRRWTLHTGDFRYDREHFDNFGQLVQLVQTASLHYLHLDTTYCSSAHVFPSQYAVLAATVAQARLEDQRTHGRCLFFFGTYTIGKERVFMRVAEELDVHIFAATNKRHILALLNLRECKRRLVNVAEQARIHVVPMKTLSATGLRNYATRNGLSTTFIGRGLAVCFRPTGWCFRGKAITREVRDADQAIMLQVAYSEHSSFEELRSFVQWVKPKRIFPTVGAYTAEKREAMLKLLGHENGAM